MIVSLVASIAVAEVCTRRWLPRPGFQEIPTQSQIVSHPQRGFFYRPNLPGFTNSLGLRDAPIRPDENVDILAVGDSFTVGGGVAMQEAWPAQLEVSLNSLSISPNHIRVVNAGVAAYSLTQIRLLTEEFAQRLRPKIVVVGLFSSRYWRIADPYVFFHEMAIRKSETQRMRVVNGGIVYTPFTSTRLQSLDFFLADHFYVGAHVLRASRSAAATALDLLRRDSPPARSTIETLLTPLLGELEQIRALCVSLNLRLVVLLVNEQEEDGSFKSIEEQYNDVVKSFCRDSGLPVADPLPMLEASARGKPIFRQGHDHHWSALAHKLAAQELQRVMTQEKVLTRERLFRR